MRQIEIATRGLVNEVFSGEYQSVFKGRGMSFAEVREYQYGDDIRAIDWNVTARSGSPHVKVFEEERELTVFLIVDVSGSGDFGTRESMKRTLMAEVCALLAFSAIRNNDRVGLLIFSDRIEKFVPPRKGSRHVLRVIRELLYHRPEGTGTDIGVALEYLARVQRRRATAFLASDFIASGYERELAVAARRHDVVALCVTDPAEREFPRVGLVEIEDAESGELVLVNTSSRAFRERFRNRIAEERALFERTLRRSGVDLVDIETGRPYVRPLMRFFQERLRRRAGP